MLSTASTWSVQIDEDCARKAKEFPAWLRSNGTAGTLDAVVDALARDVWVGAETRSLPQQLLEQHATALAQLILSVRPQPAHLAHAVDRARTGGGVAGGEPASRRIAVDIFSRARAAGHVAAHGLRDDVALFMIDRAYGHLLDEPTVAPALASSVKAFARHCAETTAAAPVGLAALGFAPATAAALERAGGASWIAGLRERFMLSERAVIRLVQMLERQGCGPDAIAAKVEHTAQWIGDAKGQLLKPSNDDADVRKLKMKAAAALGEAEFEAAAEALRKVRREIREGRRRTEERLSEEVAGLKAQMTEEARATARLAELRFAEHDFAAAAELFSEAALALPSTERELGWQFDLKRAEALHRKGELASDPGAMTEAAAAYALCVKSAIECTNETGLARASLGLGTALAHIGERETGTARLKEAVAPLKKAIAILSRDADMQAWASAQLRLGQVLALIGERDRSSAALRDAAQAFREGLKETDAKTQASAFVAAQMGLGSVLLALEEREGGVLLLEEAVDAYSAALGQIQRSDDPIRWGEAQMNLGLALLGLGEQPGGEQRLEDAVGALRKAGEISTRVAAPQKWAVIQLNLGNALAALGERSGGRIEHLEESVKAYSLALEELRRETEPLKWAITQMNLGSALIRLGERRDKRRNWLAAAGALVPALEVFETQGATQYAEVARQSLRRFHESWDSLISPAGPAPAAGAAEGSVMRRTRTG